MNAEQRIKRHILIDADLHAKDGVRIEITEDNLEELFDEANEDLELQDYIYEFRCSGEDTGLPHPNSRHYECDAVGRKLNDGTWVGWNYWYGGGKHGEPEAIDWMDGAYDLDVTEEEKMVVVKTFKVKETI
jgi:hypothetical protein